MRLGRGRPSWLASMGSPRRRSTIGRAKFGGMDVSEAKRLKALEDENAKLKKLLAEQMLDAAALRELLSKNGRARRQTRCDRASAGCMSLSERRACSIVGGIGR